MLITLTQQKAAKAENLSPDIKTEIQHIKEAMTNIKPVVSKFYKLCSSKLQLEWLVRLKLVNQLL